MSALPRSGGLMFEKNIFFCIGHEKREEFLMTISCCMSRHVS